MTRKAPSLRIALALAIPAVIVAIVPAALAGKGGGHNSGGSSSLSLVLLNSTDGLPHYGQLVTFNVTTNYSTPSVSLYCYQSGYMILSGSHPMYQPNIWDDPGIFGFSSAAWGGGAADCRADLIGQSSNGRAVTLASLSFHVYA